MRRRRRSVRGGVQGWATAGGIVAGALALGTLLAGVTVSAMDPYYAQAAAARAERALFRASRMPEPTQGARAAFSPILAWDAWMGNASDAAVDLVEEERYAAYDDPALLGPAHDWRAEERRWAAETRETLRELEAHAARERARWEEVDRRPPAPEPVVESVSAPPPATVEAPVPPPTDAVIQIAPDALPAVAPSPS